jgi:hypothetical protein
MGVWGRVGGVMVLGVLAAPPVLAIEPLGGLYDAKLSCGGIANGVKGKYKFETELSVVQQDDSNVLFQLEGTPAGAAYLLADAKKPEQGTLSGLSCLLFAIDEVGGFQGVSLHLDVKTKAGKDDASLKGTFLIYDRALAAANVCKLTAKRRSTPPLKLAPCPTA